MRNIGSKDVLFAFFIMCSCGILGCSGTSMSVDIDPAYSYALVLGAGEFQRDNDRDVKETAEKIVVYKVPDKSGTFLELKELERFDTILSSPDKSEIALMLDSVQTNKGSFSGCFKMRSKDALHVIVYREGLSDVGYFVVNKCKVDKNESALIRFLYDSGETGVVYSNKALTYFSKIGAEENNLWSE